MNIVFFGASDLGYDCCEAIIKAGHNVSGIFTIAEQFNISYSPGKPVTNYLFRDFRVLSERHNIPIVTVNGDLASFQGALEEMNPDLILAIGWYYLIPRKMLTLAPLGAVGIHASLLPKYRGNAPLVWAMINGESETGVSLFYFEGEVDSGDIIAQQVIRIDKSDEIKDLLQKVKAASVQILLEFVPRIADGTAPRTVQNEGEATYFPKRFPEDGLINWEWDARRIRNFIRAQSKPYPGAFFYQNGKKITIWGADVDEIDDRADLSEL